MKKNSTFLISIFKTNDLPKLDEIGELEGFEDVFAFLNNYRQAPPGIVNKIVQYAQSTSIYKTEINPEIELFHN